jgi:hypothetical protein
MTHIVIRRLEGDEMLEAMYSLTSYALHASPPLTDQAEWNEIVRPRQDVTYMALFEDGVPASGAAATAMIENVRGKLFAAHGVWGVATAPAARRNGYCRRAMAALLAAGRADGQVFSTLYPFRESFYERLGYVTFPLTRIARFAPPTLEPLLARFGSALASVQTVTSSSRGWPGWSSAPTIPATSLFGAGATLRRLCRRPCEPYSHR